ncbi:MAG: putative E2 ubiquitin-conjugating enzyme [Piptocephalis tieghemiana]|nr:MAG: putative E2 ubiquitin-conjugating enzyme [Piptocephalis tieghemiana]
MIKLRSLKKDNATTSGSTSSSSGPSKKARSNPGQIRIQKDLSEMDLPSTMKMSFPNPDDILHFTMTIKPDEGYYQGGTFHFTFTISPEYPHQPPKVLCTQKIYHPNIDPEGKICLNILREDWKPVLSLNAVVVGLQFLFLEPNPDDPLNKEAANVLRSNRHTFANNVRTSMRGGMVNGETYDVVL